MTAALVFATIVDIATLAFVGVRALRGRKNGYSMRIVLFASLLAATLAGAFVTGLYVVTEEANRSGLIPLSQLLARIAPKAFLVGSFLLVLSAATAAEVGRRMARSVEELTVAATRIAGGEPVHRLPTGWSREARQIARSLAAMRRELEGRPYAAAFLRDAWHDLKTPAAALKATIEVLEDGAIEDQQVARRFLANLRQSSEQLERTLDDLVTLARFETATLAPDQTTQVRAWIDEAIEQVRPLAEAKNVSIDVCAAPQCSNDFGKLRGDTSALVRALANVLDNAVKSTPNGKVSIIVDARPDDVYLNVENEPAQIPDDLKKRLFERAATSRRGSGSGLGLAIARAAIESHGGRIHFVDFGPPKVALRIELPR